MGSQNFSYEMIQRNEIYAMKPRLREILFFELKIQLKICVGKFLPFPPGKGVNILETADSGTGDTFFLAWNGDPGTGMFFFARGLRTLSSTGC